MSNGTTLAMCLFHPPPNHPVMKDLPPAYQLTREQLLDACGAFSGLSVTVEHHGVQNASNRITGKIDHKAVTKELMRSGNAKDRRIGVCLETFESADGAFFCIVEIMWDAMPGLKWLLQSKQIGSCSLTHTIVDGKAVPLELALVGVPARPGCKIVLGTPLSLFEYKRSLLTGAMSSMSDTTTAETPKVMTPEEAIMALDEPTRNLIIARMAHLSDAAIAAETKGKELAEELKQTKWSAETDMALLAGQLGQLIESMPEDAKKSYSLSLEDSMAAYKSADPRKIMNSSLRLIMCANASSMMRHSTTTESSNKRARVAEEVVPEVAAPEPTVVPAAVEAATPQAQPDQMSVLRSALYTAFEAR